MLDDSISIKGATSLIIENKSIFANLVQSIHAYTAESDDVKIYNNNYEPLKPDEIMLVTDILGYELNTAPVIKHLYSDLENQVAENTELNMKIVSIMGEITSTIANEMLDFEPDLSITEITMQKLFKALEIKIETSDLTIYERVSDIIRVFKYLSKKKLLVFINLGTFLTHKQMEATAEYISFQNMSTLLLDSYPFHAPNNINQFVMDNDFDVIKTKPAL